MHKTLHLEKDIAAVADCCGNQLNLRDAALGLEYFYQSLPLCVIDAVFSIGVRYEGVQNVVRRYCEYFNLREFRELRSRAPVPSEQQSLSSLMYNMRTLGIEKFTRDIFQNRQRTSSRNGILKSEAVFRFANGCCDSGIDFLQDVSPKALDAGLERKLNQIPGQNLSVGYFFMLAGSEDLIKPDRWILSFLTRCIGRYPSLLEAQSLLRGACDILGSTHSNLTPRLLDNVIWKHERSKN